MSNPTFDQAFQILNLAREAGVSLETLQALYATGLLSDLLRAENPIAVNREAFRVILGYDPSVFRVKMGGSENTDQIVAALREDGLWVNDYITQTNFPLKPNALGEDEIEIVDPDRSFSEEEGLQILKDKGLTRPTYEHAIRFAKQHGKTTTSEKKLFVIFLHEAWQDPDGDRRVLYVNRYPDNRELNLNYPDNRFNDNCVLVGVRSRKPLHFTPAPISWGRKFL